MRILIVKWHYLHLRFEKIYIQSVLKMVILLKYIFLKILNRYLL